MLETNPLHKRWAKPVTIQREAVVGDLITRPKGWTEEHGISMVIENVRQLRHEVDDYCPVDDQGRKQHTYDYREGGCWQVQDAEVTANLGWGTASLGSALVMRRG